MPSTGLNTELHQTDGAVAQLKYRHKTDIRPLIKTSNSAATFEAKLHKNMSPATGAEATECVSAHVSCGEHPLTPGDLTEQLWPIRS